MIAKHEVHISKINESFRDPYELGVPVGCKLIFASYGFAGIIEIWYETPRNYIMRSPNECPPNKDYTVWLLVALMPGDRIPPNFHPIESYRDCLLGLQLPEEPK